MYYINYMIDWLRRHYGNILTNNEKYKTRCGSKNRIQRKKSGVINEAVVLTAV